MGELSLANSNSNQQSFVEKHLDAIKQKMENTNNIEDLLDAAWSTDGLLGAQGKRTSRESLMTVFPKLKENTEIVAKSWNGRNVWWFSVSGAIISILGSGIGAVGSTYVVWKSVGDAASIYNKLAPWTAAGQFGSAIGQGLETVSRLITNDHTATREIAQAKVALLTFNRDKYRDAMGTHSHRSEQSMQGKRDASQKLHQAKVAPAA